MRDYVIIVVVSALLLSGTLALGRAPRDAFGQVIGQDYLADYLAHYTSGRLLLRGEADGIYSWQAQYAVQTAAVGADDARSLFVSPPFMMAFYVPLAALPSLPSAFLWLGITLLLVGEAVPLLRPLGPSLSAESWGLTFLVAAAAQPTVELLGSGKIPPRAGSSRCAGGGSICAGLVPDQFSRGRHPAMSAAVAVVAFGLVGRLLDPDGGPGERAARRGAERPRQGRATGAHSRRRAVSAASSNQARPRERPAAASASVARSRGAAVCGRGTAARGPPAAGTPARAGSGRVRTAPATTTTAPRGLGSPGVPRDGRRRPARRSSPPRSAARR